MFERFARDARVAVVLAQEEARDLGAREIGVEHVLLGVLQGADGALRAVFDDVGLAADGVRDALGPGEDTTFAEDAEALRAIGIDLHAVRDAVEKSFGPDAFDSTPRRCGRRRRRHRGHLPFDRPARKALELALREALAHKGREIHTEHVLLGILRGGDRTALGLIAPHVDPARLCAAVTALLERAA